LSSYSHTWVVLPHPSIQDKFSDEENHAQHSRSCLATRQGEFSWPQVPFLQHGLGFLTVFHVIRFPNPFLSLLSSPPLSPCLTIRTTATDLLLGVRTEETNHALVSSPQTASAKTSISSHLISFESCRLGIASAMPRHNFPTVSALHSCVTSEAKGTEGTQFSFSSLSSRKAAAALLSVCPCSS
jgi:hypothetical protein